EIVVIQTSQEEEAIARGRKYNFPHRRYGNDLAFWLPEVLDIKEIIDRFTGIPIDGISCHPVSLEHIYLEVTQGKCSTPKYLSPKK
ncbi:MAG: ABC transporter ATP-binding protein, partial [Coleofasciculaceae cyanobacterium SM2_1_6]|nr:ABC transporter ATP-binding protein [Coleofasciculaceae cyanobacterium SM2_1_6]